MVGQGIWKPLICITILIGLLSGALPGQAGSRVLLPDLLAESRLRIQTLTTYENERWEEASSMDSHASTDWAKAVNVSEGGPDVASPALATTSDGTVHLVWEQNNRIYYSFLQDTEHEIWSTPQAVATGERPDIAAGKDGTLFLVFANQFGGTYNIYCVRRNGNTWGLPRNVSKTSGISYAPRVAVAPDGSPHVVWSDNTPGYHVIYHGYHNGKYWVNEPIPNARGVLPTLAFGVDGTMHVAWQDRIALTNFYNVYYAKWDQYSWTLPVNVSVTNGAHSIVPDILVATDGTVHLVWEEEITRTEYHIFYSLQLPEGGWSVPVQVSEEGSDARGPRLALSYGHYLHLIWQQGSYLKYRQRSGPAGVWEELNNVAYNDQGLENAVLSTDPDNNLHAAWAGWLGTGIRNIFYSRRGPAEPLQQWFPLISGG